jgi:exosortase
MAVEIESGGPLVAQPTGPGSEQDRLLPLAGGLLLLLTAAAYWPTIRMTADIISASEDMAHGLFAPVVAAFIIHYEWARIRAAANSPSWWGLPVLAFAATVALVALLGGSSTLHRAAMIFTLIGGVLAIGGGSLLRLTIFPISLLLFTFPIPVVLYGEITQPLQLFASQMAERVFELIGYSVIREGNVLTLSHQVLSVEEACSGIRSLVSLSFFCLSYAYFFERSFLPRLLIVLAAVPAALAMNVTRIVATGVISKYDESLTKGTAHDALAWTVFVAGFAVVLLGHRLVRARFPEKP